MPQTQHKMLNAEWAARSEKPRRSVFGNYCADGSSLSERGQSVRGSVSRGTVESSDVPRVTDARSRGDEANSGTLQASIDLAMARSFIHRFLAKAYEDPMPEGWAWLCDAGVQDGLRAATGIVATSRQNATIQSNALENSLQTLSAALCRDAATRFHDAYLATFGHAARGSCPMNEIEYGDLKADPLFQPHRLADLAAFYRAFDLQLTEDASERQDHICIEMEFMSVLAAKEAYALEHQLDADQIAQCREAQKKFLREHLGRWTPAFARRLAGTTNEPTLRSLAEFTRAFIESECARFGVNAGSEDLLLRPVDETAESMCASCGINQLPPGAVAVA